MLAFLLSAIIPQQTQPLGVYDIGGEKVPAVLPTWTAERKPPQYLDSGGYRYHFSGGNLVGRTLGTGEWSDLPALVAKANSQPVIEWPLMIFVSGESESLARTEYGFWAQKRALVENEELRQVRREVALFCELVKAHTGGRVAIRPQFEVDAEVITVPAGHSLMAPAFEQVLSRLTHSTKSAFVLTSELDDKIGTMDGRNSPIPIAFVPVFASLDPLNRGKLARCLLTQWTRQAQSVARHGGLPITVSGLEYHPMLRGRPLEFPVTPDDVLRGFSVWSELAKPDSFGTPRSTAPGAWNWLEVSDDPWVKLPLLSQEQIRAHNVLEIGLQNRGTAQFGNWRVVQDRYADLVGEKSGLKAVGYFALGGRLVVAFEGGSPAMTDAQLIGSLALQNQPEPTSTIPTALPFNAGEAEKLAASGFWQVTTVVDSDRGAVAEIRELPRPRNNWLRLIGNGGNATAIDLAKTPYLEFWIKPRIVGQPVDIVAEGPGIKTRIRLFGRAIETEVRKDVPKAHLDLGLAASSDWQFVSLDMRAMGTGEISNLYLATPDESYYWSNFGPTFQIFLDDLKVAEKASATVSELKKPTVVPAIAEASDPLSRAAAVANADPETLLKLMSDSHSLVSLNAFLAYEAKIVPGAEKLLTEGTKSLSHRVSEICIRELAKSQNPEARALIGTILRQGPFDHMKRFAATAVTTFRTDKTLAADLSILLASRSWQTRLAAGLSTPRVEGDTSKIVAMAFVNDAEPYVRFLITQSAYLEVKEVEARVMSLLDPAIESSAMVRMAAAVKLSATKFAVVTKFLAAESRLAKMLCVWQADPAKHRALLEFLATDSLEEVKQAALQKLR